ncbi:hypothetical protein A1O3_03690 [Capronia epimyces CBS 606.96]|uniref:DUF6594 domain-containing protein n=1 Tax=Capronia epimyces CBS 606.96 TaxID=1182542 RepID=W9YBU8_9EURO|nr:uncharacterized protein A1O3_03690 [Capronia epimyces CBS 606.96]EXJ86736.1 hypothetical protein A1O3_03690 [Capronia epimyces CBS 606.96]
MNFLHSALPKGIAPQVHEIGGPAIGISPQYHGNLGSIPEQHPTGEGANYNGSSIPYEFKVPKRRKDGDKPKKRIWETSFEERFLHQGLRLFKHNDNDHDQDKDHQFRPSPVFYKTGEKFTVSFRGLQRLNLHAMQRKLVVLVGTLANPKSAGLPAQLDKLERAMATYVSALRDWDYMMQPRHVDRWEDPCLITSDRVLDLSLMIEAGLVQVKESRGASGPKDYDDPILPGDSKTFVVKQQDLQLFFKRFVAAIFGGIALLGPVILMVLKQDMLTTLLTASVSVILFAFALVCFSEESVGSLIGLVAAYTAVLVVFIGTSTPGVS